MHRVTEHVIPQEIRDLALSPEDIWKIGREAGGWELWTNHEKGNDVFMHRNCIVSDYPEHIPEFLKKMEQYDDENSTISMFVSDNDETQHSLSWHVDGYEVYGFNIEGHTRWDWFDIPTGEIKSIYLGEMDKLIHMPCGYTHRVTILSEGRTSISLVLPSEF